MAQFCLLRIANLPQLLPVANLQVNGLINQAVIPTDKEVLYTPHIAYIHVPVPVYTCIPATGTGNASLYY